MVFLQVYDKDDLDDELFSISFTVDILPGEFSESGDLGVVDLINSKPELTLPPPDRISVAYGEELRLDLGYAIDVNGSTVEVTLSEVGGAV